MFFTTVATGSANDDAFIFYREGGQYKIDYDANHDGTWTTTVIGASLDGNQIQIDGAGGDDYIEAHSTITDALAIGVTLTGNTGNDELIGAGTHDDFLDASAGNDTLYVGLGDDTLAGGSNTDLADAHNAADFKVNWSLDGSANDEIYNLVGVRVYRYQSIGTEKITGTAFNDTITGSGSADTLAGAGGNDSISGVGGDDSILGESGTDYLDGGSGNDTLIGGSGADTLYGQSGQDRFNTSDGSANDYADGGSDSDSILASDAGDTFVNIP